MSCINKILNNTIYRRGLLLIILVLIFTSVWKLAYNITWSGTKKVRLERLYDYSKFDFEFSNNWNKLLKVNEVIYTDSQLNNGLYTVLFYYFVTERDTLHSFEKLRSSVSFLDYLLAQKSLDPKKYLILICGEQRILERLLALKGKNDFKYVKKALVNPNIFKKLSLPSPTSSLIITNKDYIVWCSIGYPDDFTLSQLLEKLIS